MYEVVATLFLCYLFCLGSVLPFLHFINYIVLDHHVSCVQRQNDTKVGVVGSFHSLSLHHFLVLLHFFNANRTCSQKFT